MHVSFHNMQTLGQFFEPLYTTLEIFRKIENSRNTGTCRYPWVYLSNQKLKPGSSRICGGRYLDLRVMIPAGIPTGMPAGYLCGPGLVLSLRAIAVPYSMCRRSMGLYAMLPLFMSRAALVYPPCLIS